MEFNIALNTIVYLMIFIFPGILFRKFFFVREFSPGFNKGNLFERSIWTLFTSIVMLALSAAVFYLLIKVLHLKLLSSISYSTVHKTFAEISANKLPDPNEANISGIYLDFAFLMCFIYTLSALFGLFSYFLASSSVIRSTGFLKYLNYYQDLVKGTGHNTGDDSTIYGYTRADVMVDMGESSKLYSGKVKNYFLQPSSNKLQTIVLYDVVGYKEVDDEIVIKEIPGHHFVIEEDRILNINFTYVYESKDSSKYVRRLNFAVNVIFSFAIIVVVSSLFWSPVYVYTSTILRKILFVLCGTLVLLMLNRNVKILLRRQFSSLKIEDLFFTLLFALTFVWIFNLLQWGWVLLMQFAVWVISSVILSKRNPMRKISKE